jgi:hypothetical protein
MIDLVEREYKMTLSKFGLEKLENKILVALKFDVQWAGPLPFLERYLRLLKLHSLKQLEQLASEICLLSLFNTDICLKVKPSVVAAGAILAAIHLS